MNPARAPQSQTHTTAPPSDVRAALTVREAVPSDGPALTFFFDAILRRDYFLKRGQLDDMLADDRHHVLVAEIDVVLVGVAILTAGTRLVNVLVHPAYRGLGIGHEIVKQSGAREVRAKLDVSTGDPRGFYEQLGFRRTGEFNVKRNIELLRRDETDETPGVQPRLVARAARKPSASSASRNPDQGDSNHDA